MAGRISLNMTVSPQAKCKVLITTPLGNRMLVAIWQWQSGNGTGWRFGARDDRHDGGPAEPVTTGMQALKRIAQPADVASVVAFLASDEVGHRQGLWRSPRTRPLDTPEVSPRSTVIRGRPKFRQRCIHRWQLRKPHRSLR
jgi:hypothetical protein